MDIADLDVLSNRLKQRVESSKEKQRDDDKNEVLDIRLSNFFKQIELIKQYYEKLGLLFKIDAANEKEVIFESISSVVDDLPHKISINQTKVAHENEVSMKSIKKQLTSKQMNTDLVGEIVQVLIYYFVFLTMHRWTNNMILGRGSMVSYAESAAKVLSCKNLDFSWQNSSECDQAVDASNDQRWLACHIQG